ncbi:MAG: hypothetical protein ACR2QC_07705 [Gammaproteobacteria bacterium]
MSLDLDRGVTKRQHPNGMQICMYKDDPGVFMDVNGGRIASELADGAGFPVAALKVERIKMQRFAEARAKIEREFDEKTAGLEAEIEREFEPVRPAGGEAITSVASQPQEPVSEAPEGDPAPQFKLQYAGSSWYNIVNLEGEIINDKKMRRDQAAETMARLGIEVDELAFQYAIDQYNIDTKEEKTNGEKEEA